MIGGAEVRQPVLGLYIIARLEDQATAELRIRNGVTKLSFLAHVIPRIFCNGPLISQHFRRLVAGSSPSLPPRNSTFARPALRDVDEVGHARSNVRRSRSRTGGQRAAQSDEAAASRWRGGEGVFRRALHGRGCGDHAWGPRSEGALPLLLASAKKRRPRHGEN
jgi:hypothetical protein